MKEYGAGSVLLGGYIVTGKLIDLGTYPCIGPTGERNTVYVCTEPERCAAELEQRLAAWEALNHPGILTPVKHGRENGSLIVVVKQDLSTMPPLCDKSFNAKFYPVDDDTPYNMLTNSGLKYLFQSAETLGYMASQGFVHGDVKPENIRHSEEGIYISEYLLLPGGYTPAYCSPEQFEGKKLTCKTDVYSWAVSVMELYGGARPWPNGVVAGLNCAEYLGQTERTRGLFKGMRHLLERCLDMEPENRPDWAEIIKTLRGWLDDWELPCRSEEENAADSNGIAVETVCDFAETVYEGTAEAVPAIETTADGRYRIGRRIETGPPFEIYEATEVKSGKAATLLRLSPGHEHDEPSQKAMLNRYVNSVCASSVGYTSCPNIVEWTNNSYLDRNIEYLIYDGAYGQSLIEWIKHATHVHADLAVYLSQMLLVALNAAHQPGASYSGQGDFCLGIGKPLVHRSVGVRNIRIVEEENGLPKLLLDGFETALPAGRETDEQFCGSPAFSSRWQLINANMPDPAWDVWAAAACLYYMLTNKPPRDLAGRQWWNALLKEKPVPIRERKPDIAPKLAEVIDRALDDSGTPNYATAKELMAALVATKA